MQKKKDREMTWRAGGISALGITAMFALLSEAAEPIETFTAAADKFGLWAAVAMVLMGATMFAYYKQAVFIQGTLVGLIEKVHRVCAEVADAINDAPCGQGTKSDGQQKTPY